MYSDASNSACGALIKGNQTFVSHKMFSYSEKILSSTHRELIVILYSLEAFGEKLHNFSVKWFTYNQVTARIVDIGNMKLALHQLAFDVFSYYMSTNIDLHVQWIPREFNFEADAISKFKDCDDWQLSHEFFLVLESKWGPHTLDCFASFYNAKTLFPILESRYIRNGRILSVTGRRKLSCRPPCLHNSQSEQCLCDCCRSGMALRNFLAVVVATSLQMY